MLLVEDDSVIANVMSTHLRRAGFDVEWVDDGERGLARLRHSRPDVAVIDLMLPRLDGWALTEAARRDSIRVPIIAISARGAEHDKVHTLGLGADDYLAKPFGMRELVARVEALLRRSRDFEPVVERDGDILVEGLLVDEARHRVRVRTQGDQPVEAWPDAGLTPTEYRLLLALARANGRTLSRDELQQRVWGTRPRHRDRTIDVCIRKLRDKLDRASPSHTYLHTHRGVGYRFEPEARTAS